jgi:hypothetical protein
VDGAFGLLGVLLLWILLDRLTSSGVFGHLGELGLCICRMFVLRRDLVIMIKILEMGLMRPGSNGVALRKSNVMQQKNIRDVIPVQRRMLYNRTEVSIPKEYLQLILGPIECLV